MTARPRSLAAVGNLFLLVGAGGIVAAAARYHGTVPGATAAAELRDLLLASASGALAVLGGALLLGGRAWGRRILVAWMAGHLLLSLLHSAWMLAVHAAIFAPLLWLLLRPAASAWLAEEGGGKAGGGTGEGPAPARERAPPPGS